MHVDQARAFAVQSHGSQKYGPFPYVFHLDTVAMLVMAHGGEAMTVAYLHDVVEDTPTTIEHVRAAFGETVARCVALLTDESGAKREDRKEKTHAKLARAGADCALGLIVKAADRLANLRMCQASREASKLAMYQREHVAFRAAAYRAGLCDELWEEIDRLIAGAPVTS